LRDRAKGIPNVLSADTKEGGVTMVAPVSADVIGQLRQAIAGWKRTQDYKRIVELTEATE